MTYKTIANFIPTATLPKGRRGTLHHVYKKQTESKFPFLRPVPASRASVSLVSSLEEDMKVRGQDLPDFLHRSSQVTSIVEENNAIVRNVKQLAQKPSKQIQVLARHLKVLSGAGKKKRAKKGKGEKQAKASTEKELQVPDDPAKVAELKAEVEARLTAEKENLKAMTADIKPATRRAKNVANFRAILDEKRKEKQKKQDLEKMKRVKHEKEEEAKAAEAEKEVLVIESQKNWSSASPLAKQIVSVLETVIYRPLHGDEYDSIGRGALAERVQKTVDAGEELVLYMLAFPFKSKCAAKVVGILPDLAEEAALKTLGKLLTDLNAIYEHGARYVLISDGLPFNDVFGVRDDVMLSYLLKVQEMCRRTHPKLEARSMYEIFPEQVCQDVVGKGGDLESCFDEPKIRDEIFNVYRPSESWVKMQREIDAGFNFKGGCFMKFLYEDADPVDFASNSQRRQVAKARAKKMLQRDEALRIFSLGALPNAIRVSIRPRSQAGPTYCINMIGSTQREVGAEVEQVADLTTPWHNVLVRVDAEGTACRDGDRNELLESDKTFYIRHKFVSCFDGARPIVGEDGRLVGYSVPQDSLTKGDPTKNFCSSNATEHRAYDLPPPPSPEEMRRMRKRAVENARKFGWSETISNNLKRNGDRILNKEVTRDMVRFGAGNDVLLLNGGSCLGT